MLILSAMHKQGNSERDVCGLWKAVRSVARVPQTGNCLAFSAMINLCRSWGVGKKQIYRSRAPEKERRVRRSRPLGFRALSSWTGRLPFHPSRGSWCEWSLHPAIHLIFLRHQSPHSRRLVSLHSQFSAQASGRRSPPAPSAAVAGPTPASSPAARRARGPWRAPSSADARGGRFDAPYPHTPTTQPPPPHSLFFC